MAKDAELKKFLEIFYQKKPYLARASIYKRFISLGAPKRSLIRWQNVLESGRSLQHQKGAGRPGKIATKSNINAIKRMFNHRSGCSQRKAARRYQTSQPYISMILNKYTSVRCRKKFKKPRMTELQKKAARPKCRKLVELYRNCDFILDDKSYLTLSNTALPGNDCFYSDDIETTPDDVKNDYQAKFEQKLLVYVVMSPRNMSKALIFPSGTAVNQFVFRNECMKKILVPFVNENYRRG